MEEMFSFSDDGNRINIPKSFNGYNIIRLLNKGGFCCVVLVEKSNTHQQYAAKIMSKRYMENTNSVNLIMNEIKIHQMLDHPNIVQFYEAFSIFNDFDEEYYIIITEYCENGDLFDYIYDHDFQDEDEKKEMLFGILKAIQYLHNKGISHGDIKPENILLDKYFNPKLCDFGFAKTTFMCKNSDKRGTLLYSSPEMFEMNDFDAMKSDIYSLGITFFVLSEKIPPYSEGDDYSIIRSIKYGYLIIDPNDQLQNIVARLTKKNPKERATIIDVIHDEYFNF